MNLFDNHQASMNLEETLSAMLDAFEDENHEEIMSIYINHYTPNMEKRHDIIELEHPELVGTDAYYAWYILDSYLDMGMYDSGLLKDFNKDRFRILHNLEKSLKYTDPKMSREEVLKIVNLTKGILECMKKYMK